MSACFTATGISKKKRVHVSVCLTATTLRHPGLRLGLRHMRSSRLCRHRHAASGVPQVCHTDDDDESVKPSLHKMLHNLHVKMAIRPADEEVEIYQGKDALQKDLPHGAVPLKDDDCY